MTQKTYAQFIENNYTGPIDQGHCEDIIKSLKISFVNWCQIYMAEFGTGLNAYSLKDLNIQNSEVCWKVFVMNTINPVSDVNYLYSII